VYCYFDNDVKVRAPYDAMALRIGLELGPPPEETPEVTVAPGPSRPWWPGFAAPAPAYDARP
jgi:hypothetical protein